MSSSRDLSQSTTDGQGNSALADINAALPWEAEPDRKEWLDGSTGYACLAQRGPSGAWCGYVAVPRDHPARGRSYYSDNFDIASVLQDADVRASAIVQQAINEIRVHGGLTFAGDRDHAEAPEDAWWFGFDCAHAGDYSPKYGRVDHPVLGLGRPTGWGGVITYRTLGYVEGEIASLADQLARIASDGTGRDPSPSVTSDAVLGTNS